MGGTRSLIHGLHTDTLRTSYGLTTGMERACHGRSTVLVLSRDACRAGGCVFVSCSFCVRSSFGRVLCGVRLVLVRVAFVRGGSQGEAADCGRRRVHLRTWEGRGGLSTGQRRTSDRRLTGGHSSDADILRHSEMGGGAAADLPRTRHGLSTDGTWACLRASDGRATGGLRSDMDKPRCAEMGGGRLRSTRTSLGRHTDWKRTPLSHKLLTELAALPTL